MEKVRRLRSMGSLCRQQAAYNPAQSWKLLAEAEYWEHLAESKRVSTSKNAIRSAQMTQRKSASQRIRMTPDGLSPREYRSCKVHRARHHVRESSAKCGACLRALPAKGDHVGRAARRWSNRQFLNLLSQKIFL